MTKEELKIFLENKYPNCKTELTSSCVVLHFDADNLLGITEYLKSCPETQFDFLCCQTAVDRLSHFELVYTLTSTDLRHMLVLKTTLTDRENAEIESVISLWYAAELYECEIFDLFGIRFKNHPTLRRIFLGDEWKGFPLRKDYKDDVNVLTL
jgi:NADH-quinone oxidoreductase subunit C